MIGHGPRFTTSNQRRSSRTIMVHRWRHDDNLSITIINDNTENVCEMIGAIVPIYDTNKDEWLLPFYMAAQ